MQIVLAMNLAYAIQLRFVDIFLFGCNPTQLVTEILNLFPTVTTIFLSYFSEPYFLKKLHTKLRTL
jgi:hypothetical protein